MYAPLVSVILPTLNRIPFLSISVGSVLAQDFPDFELIIVDDGSTDDVQSAVEGFRDSRLRYIRRETNGGPAAARNTGIAHARGRYIAFQDSDDEWMLGKLKMQVAAIEREYGDTMCIGSLVRYFGDQVRLYRPAAEQKTVLSLKNIMETPIAYTQTWLVPRVALEQVGGFDEKLKIWEDWDLLLRLAEVIKLKATPDALVYSERFDDSVTGDASAFIESMDYLLEKHADLLSSEAKVWAKLHYMRARRLMNLGRWEPAMRDLQNSVSANSRQWRAWVALFSIRLGLRPVLNRITAGARVSNREGEK
jgi:glycosyltransferase involved in cell wall biosynthesis